MGCILICYLAVWDIQVDMIKQNALPMVGFDRYIASSCTLMPRFNIWNQI